MRYVSYFTSQEKQALKSFLHPPPSPSPSPSWLGASAATGLDASLGSPFRNMGWDA